MNKALATKLFKVMEGTESVAKSLDVAGQYRAVGESDVLNMLKPLFKEQKLIIIPKDGDITEDVFLYKSGQYDKLRAVTHLKVNFTIIDTETGESIDIVGFGNGADTQDKGSGKAFTYAFKTALMKTFMMFSGEDTDNTHSDDIGNIKKPPTPTKEEKWTNFLDNEKKIFEDQTFSFEDAVIDLGYDMKSIYDVTDEDIKAEIYAKLTAKLNELKGN